MGNNESANATAGFYSINTVLMEATGGLEAAVTCALQAEGFELAVVTPKQSRNFARAMGYRAKTGRIASRELAQMAEVIHHHPERELFIRAQPDAERQVLTAIVVRGRQLITILMAERNRLPPAHPQSRKNINIIIQALENDLTRIDDDMNRYIQGHLK